MLQILFISVCMITVGQAQQVYRLAGGATPNEGRVEVLVNGTWGTVCDLMWLPHFGKVLCRQLGLPASGAASVLGAGFGEGQGPLWSVWGNCTGNESTLDKCFRVETDPLGLCTHAKDVGVICQDDTVRTHIRLVGGQTQREGRVQIRQNGVWGTICTDGFVAKSASVICRMLGYTSYERTFRKFNGDLSNPFGEGQGQTWLYRLFCWTGRELDISHCMHKGWGNSGSCTHAQDLAVRCSL